MILLPLLTLLVVQASGQNAPLSKEIAILPPASATQIDVKFRILGRESSFFTIDRNISDLKKLPLDPSLRTIFLIHGWLDTKATAEFWWRPILNTVRKFNSHRDQEHERGYQVIFVDWSGGSSSSYYLPAVSNLRVAAGVLSHMITILVDDLNFDPSLIRLIGFSLGAHLAGFAGKLLTGKHRLAWITGLEPANAFFELSSPAGSIFRSDARYVDIVHTSSGSVWQGFSKVGPLGCTDFYVNGASGSRQAGCEEDMPLGAIGGFFSYRRPCAHDRSPLLFATLHSTDDCQNVAFACSSYERFLDGQCSACEGSQEDCKIFGFQNDVSSNDWPLHTDEGATVCTHRKFFLNASPLRSCRES